MTQLQKIVKFPDEHESMSKENEARNVKSG